MNIPGVGDLSNMGINPEEIINQVKDRISFPANKEQIVTAVKDIPNIPEPVKQYVESKLPEGEYQNEDEVKKAMQQ